LDAERFLAAVPRPTHALAILLLAPLFAGCTGGSEVDDEQRTFRILSLGSNSDLDEEGIVTRTFTDDATWQAFWDDHTSGLSPAIAAPEVDFDTEAAIAVVDGMRPNGGYSLEIMRVTLDGQATVEYEVAAPGPSCITPAVVTRPFHFVAVQKDVVAVGVDWDRDENTYTCGS
jgi:hypothetical protein